MRAATSTTSHRAYRSLGATFATGTACWLLRRGVTVTERRTRQRGGVPGLGHGAFELDWFVVLNQLRWVPLKDTGCRLLPVHS